MKKLIVLFVLTFLSLPYFASSQEVGGKNILDNWSLNVNGGASLFWGDLRQYKFYPVTNYTNEWNAAYGFILTKKLSSTFELRGQFIKGDLTGTRRPSKTYFKAQFNEYNMNITMNFSRLFLGDDPCRRLNFYGIAGLGFIDFRSVKKLLGSDKFIESRGYSANGTVEEKMETESVVTLGFGAKYKLDSRFEINLENIWSVVNSDLIDVTKGGFKYDILSYTSIGLTYKFNFRNNPSVFADCGDLVSSRTRKGSLGEGGHYSDDASKAEKDSLNAKLKRLEDKLNNQDTKIKDLENKINVKPTAPIAPVAPAEINVEELKRSIYNSILDTLKRNPTTTIVNSGYMQFSIFFDVNAFNIKNDQLTKIASIAEYMKSDKELKLKIVGNADQTGSVDYNNYLSKKRAEQVYNTLTNKYGIDKARLSFEGKGKADIFSKEYKLINRRVDFIRE
ncbi:MAG: OmpA family protein [Bacteroidetes bacterium]|nr:OmpA family protein [Bacteroidota bacterium]